MPDKTYAKVVLNGTTYVDLTSDTVDPSTLLAGYTAHDRSGALITGTFDSSIFVLKAGDTMTGPLILSGAPTENLHAATKKYVDDNIPTALADLSDDSTHRLVTDLATGRWDQILKKAQSKGAGYNYVQDSFELKTIDTSTASTPYRARYTLESDAVNYMNSDVKTGGFTVSFKYKAVKNASQNLRLIVAIEAFSGSGYTRQTNTYSITTYSTSWNTLKLQMLGYTSTALTTSNFRYLSFKLNDSDNGTLAIKDVRLEIGDNTNLIGPYAWSEYDEKRYTRRYIGNQASKITANNDLNSLGMLKPGYFICETDTIAASVTNCPTQKAFWLETFNLSYVEQPSEYYYIVQKIVEYTSEPPNMYIRRHKCNSTAGTVSSGSWFKILTVTDDLYSQNISSNNLIDKSMFYMGSLSGADGTDTAATTRVRSVFIPVSPSTSYHISNSNTIQIFEIHEYTLSKTFIQYTSINATSATFTTTSTTVYIRVLMRKTDNSNICPFELGNIYLRKTETVDSGYTPYEPNTDEKYVYNLNAYNIGYRFIQDNSVNVLANANLNSTAYLKPGQYYVDKSATVATLTNCPVATAFTMNVENPISPIYGDESSRKDIYRIRRITALGGDQYIQYCACPTTANTWTYGAWNRVETETSGTTTVGSIVWAWKKHSNGMAEMWADVTLNGTWVAWGNMYYLSYNALLALPFTLTKKIEDVTTYLNTVSTMATSAFPINYTSMGSYNVNNYTSCDLARPTAGDNNKNYYCRKYIKGLI